MNLDAVLEDLEAAWNEPDADERRRRLERVWAADGTYVTSDDWIEGRDALLAHLGAALSLRGGRFKILGEPESLDGRLRFRTALTDEDGRALAHEVAFAELAPDGQVTRLTTFATAPSPASSRVHRLLAWATESPVNLLQFLGLVGAVVYVLLRISVAIFYARLNTTPEETGLDEVQMLRESALMLGASLIAAFAWAVIIVTAIVAWNFLHYPVTSHWGKLRRGARSTYREKARHILVPILSLLVLGLPILILGGNVVWGADPEVFWVLLALTPITTLLSAVLAVLFYESIRVVFDHARVRIREVRAGKGARLFFGTGVVVLAALAIVAFPIYAWERANQVRDGANAIDGRFEPWQAQRAEVRWKLEDEPYALPGCESLRFLGSNDGTMILFDSARDLTYRLSTDDVVVRTWDANDCESTTTTTHAG